MLTRAGHRDRCSNRDCSGHTGTYSRSRIDLGSLLFFYLVERGFCVEFSWLVSTLWRIFCFYELIRFNYVAVPNLLCFHEVITKITFKKQKNFVESHNLIYFDCIVNFILTYKLFLMELLTKLSPMCWKVIKRWFFDLSTDEFVKHFLNLSTFAGSTKAVN